MQESLMIKIKKNRYKGKKHWICPKVTSWAYIYYKVVLVKYQSPTGKDDRVTSKNLSSFLSILTVALKRGPSKNELEAITYTWVALRLWQAESNPW